MAFPALHGRSGVRAGAVSPPALSAGDSHAREPEAIGERMRASGPSQERSRARGTGAFMFARALSGGGASEKAKLFGFRRR